MAKWMFILLVSVLIGTAAGVAARYYLLTPHRVLSGGRVGVPVVKVTNVDYQAINGVVPQFAQWGVSPLCDSFKVAYPAASMTLSDQRTMFDTVVSEGVHAGAISDVINGCATRAIVEANARESEAAQPLGPHTTPITLLIYAEKCSYFGQDAWAFLCLSSANQKNGNAWAMVISAAPSFGLLHSQHVGTF